MRKIYFMLAIIVGVMFTSCGMLSVPKKTTIPVATNTISSVSFGELNLEREDYNILNTIEVASLVTVVYSKNGDIKISDDSGYTIEIAIDDKTGAITTKSSGVLRYGFLTNDYGSISYDNPEAIARATAFSRLVSLAKENGGDALIEPIVSTNLEEQDGSGRNRTIVYSTTASAKVIVIKTDK